MVIGMKIGIVGLGLIGGSLAKAIKKNTNHICFGYDINSKAVADAIQQESIDGSFSPDQLSSFDLVILGLYPDDTINFIDENLSNFKKGGIVIDTCGVKEEIIKAVDQKLNDMGVYFIGCHPMAGREFSGFEYSLDNLFEKASFIITPTENTNQQALEKLEKLSKEIGFIKNVIATPKKHDEIIAFTSQLAHIVSSAYVKSPALLKQSGFSAGSFKDLTRVAMLNEKMWTTLFMMNRSALLGEINHIIEHLTEYKTALENEDRKALYDLLRIGKELKEKSNELNAKK